MTYSPGSEERYLRAPVSFNRSFDWAPGHGPTAVLRTHADIAGAGLERLLPITFRLLEQSDDGCTRRTAREPACCLEKRFAIETRAGKNGLDPLPRKDLCGFGQSGYRTDFEAGKTLLMARIAIALSSGSQSARRSRDAGSFPARTCTLLVVMRALALGWPSSQA
jgi:hypothetical protein